MKYYLFTLSIHKLLYSDVYDKYQKIVNSSENLYNKIIKSKNENSNSLNEIVN